MLIKQLVAHVKALVKVSSFWYVLGFLHLVLCVFNVVTFDLGDAIGDAVIVTGSIVGYLATYRKAQ